MPKDAYVLTSISLPTELRDRLSALADTVHEADAVIIRQVVRVALARRWTAEDIGARRGRGTYDKRVVGRLALPPQMKDDFQALSGDTPLSVFYTASAERFIELDKLGDRSIWNLKE